MHACQIESAAKGRRSRSVGEARDTPESKLQGASKQMASSMSEKELEELASTRRKGKPERVSD